MNSKESFMAAITSGSELKCSMDANGIPVTIYFTKDKYLLITKTPEAGNVYSAINLKEKMVYAWADKQMYSTDQLKAMGIELEPGKKMGVKSDISQQPSEEIKAEDYKPEWKCELSTYPIILPSDYQFVDMSKFYASASTNGAATPTN